MAEIKIAGRGSAAEGCAELFSRFAHEGSLESAEPYGSGHIHETLLLKTRERGCPDYILQRVNHHIFKDIPRLMENIVRVTGHLRGKVAAIPGADPDREVLTVVPARDGSWFQQDGDGNFWRCYLFIDHQRPSDRVKDPVHACETGRLFGRFLRLLADLPGPPLHQTIPGFHDVDLYLRTFSEVLQADPFRRSARAAGEIAVVQNRAWEMKRILRLGQGGRIPLRVTHNDTKFNNILFDKRGSALCVIDLDTVMPGYVHYDFGDMIRSGCNRAREDEPELARVGMDIQLFAAYAKGFFASCREGMNAAETAELAFSARLFAYMVGLRFLSDHLAGDRYFKIGRPDHNLQRARVQFRLLEDMDRQAPEMEDIVSGLAGKTTS